MRLNEHKSDKTGKPRLIVISADLSAELKALAARYPVGSLVRSRAGKAWTGKGITQAMRRTRKEAGVKGIAYGYRHTFATDALANGVPDATVAALLGHSSTAMLHKHYSHLTSRMDVLKQAVGKVR